MLISSGSGILSLRVFVTPLALGASCHHLSSDAAASALSDFFEVLVAPLCLRDKATQLQPKRQVLSWPDDAVVAVAAAVASAAASFGLSITDESWLPAAFSAVLVTVYDENTLQKILNFVVSGGSGFQERGARYLAGTCSALHQRNTIKTGHQFFIFENSFVYDDNFGTTAAIGALLQLPRRNMEHWHEPVYNNSL
jgi:hypothetical protein